MRALIEELTLALSLDENDSDVHRVLAAVNLSIHRDHDKALYHQERALTLNPNDDLIVVQQGEALTWIGQADQGIEWSRRRCASTPIIQSASGVNSAALISSRGATVKPSKRSSALAALIKVIGHLSRHATRSSTIPRRPRLPSRRYCNERQILDRALHCDAALQARERPRAPPRRTLQSAIAGVNRYHSSKWPCSERPGNVRTWTVGLLSAAQQSVALGARADITRTS